MTKEIQANLNKPVILRYDVLVYLDGVLFGMAENLPNRASCAVMAERLLSGDLPPHKSHRIEIMVQIPEHLTDEEAETWLEAHRDD